GAPAQCIDVVLHVEQIAAVGAAIDHFGEAESGRTAVDTLEPGAVLAHGSPHSRETRENLRRVVPRTWPHTGCARRESRPVDGRYEAAPTHGSRLTVHRKRSPNWSNQRSPCHLRGLRNQLPIS